MGAGSACPARARRSRTVATRRRDSALRVLFFVVIAGFVAASDAVLHSVALTSMQQSFFAESAAYERFMGRWSRQSPHCWCSLPTYATGRRSSTSAPARGVGAGAAARAAPSADHGSGSFRLIRIMRTGRAPTERVRFVVGDAQALQMPDATFDRVVSLFVMNFIPDRAKALQEMIRVTRPDGVIAAAVWDYGDGMQMLRVFWDEAVALDPAVAARDERNMPLCRRGSWQLCGANTGLPRSRNGHSRSACRFPRSRTTGNRSSVGKVRPALMSRV